MKPIHAHGLLIVVALALLVIGWLWLLAPVSDPDEATTQALEAAAEKWWRPENHDQTIPKEQWPPELERLNPKAVRVTSEGVFIPIRSFFVEERGLFVFPAGSNFVPPRSGDPSFKLLRGRVYRYEIKG
jgi:hypothetical protein